MVDVPFVRKEVFPLGLSTLVTSITTPDMVNSVLLKAESSSSPKVSSIVNLSPRARPLFFKNSSVTAVSLALWGRCPLMTYGSSMPLFASVRTETPTVFSPNTT